MKASERKSSGRIVSFQVDGKLREQLERIAAANERTLSQQIRLMLRAAVEAESKAAA